MATKSFDHVLGLIASAAGSIGLTVQVVTQFANLVLVVGNLAMVLGGFVLLYRRLQLVSTERRLAEARLRNELAKKQAANAVTDIVEDARDKI